MISRLVVVVALVVAVSACSADESTSTPEQPAPTDTAGLFPDVLDVELTDVGDGDFQVSVTLSSPYDSPDRYADAWRVLDADGNELGVRELTHDHASEQPFTRQTTVSIPDHVDQVTIEGRDQISGYGGETLTVAVPR